ncbi:MAG: 16S rRNA (uracil(1498)-N(3))-methyltransferase [Phycisphaerales bacterium]
MHRIYVPQADLVVGHRIEVSDEEAHHAVRVKRLGPGDRVGLLDGRGRLARAVVVHVERSGRSGCILVVEPEDVQVVEPVRPRVTVLSPAPKGDALEWMIDQLSQAGAAAWGLLRTAYAQREPRRLDRLHRTAVESAKQCGRAHLLELLPPVTLEQALAQQRATIVVADASGAKARTKTPLGEVCVLIGPEGGFSPQERDVIARCNAAVVNLGPHVLRMETAAVLAVAAMLRAGQE